MKRQGKRILSLILSFTMAVAGLNYFAYATETNHVEAALSFACDGYAEPELGGDLAGQLELTTEDTNMDLSSAKVTIQWLKNENTVWKQADEEQFGEGEYRLAVCAQGVAPAGEFKFPSGEQAVSVNGETFEYAEGKGLESSWQVAENKASFAVYSKVYKINGVEYWTNIFTQAGADEYADALDLEAAMDYNNDPEFAGKTDEERIEVVKGWLADVESEQPVVLEDTGATSTVYYKSTTETDAGGNQIKVLHLSSTPYLVAAGEEAGEYNSATIDRANYEKIVIDNPIAPSDGFNFKGYKKVTSIENLDLVDTSNMTDFSSMFMSCSSLTSLDVSNFDTSKATTMEGMFQNASELTIITGVEDFNVTAVTRMDYMFSGTAKIKTLDLSKYDTKSLQNTKRMFQNCYALKTISFGENFNTSKVVDMSGMFWSCRSLDTVNLENFDTSAVTDMSGMFRLCTSLEELDLSNFNTQSVSSMEMMFAMNKIGYESAPAPVLKRLNVSSFDTSKVENMANMFSTCSGLTSLDVSNFDTSKATTMYGMFSSCSKLTSLDVSNFDTSQVTTMFGMFDSCSKLTSLNLSNFNTSQVENMANMFSTCIGLKSLDISSFDTSKVTTMEGMFSSCGGLTSLDVSNFYTPKVTTMARMFQGASKLTTIEGVENFNVEAVTKMDYMFSDTANIETLDLSKYDTKLLKYTQRMFQNCYALKTISFGKNFNTSKVVNMSGMFWRCISLKTVNLENFDTGAVTDMSGMFRLCTSLEELDLSNFNTQSVTSMKEMFSMNKLYESIDPDSVLKKLNLSSFDTSKGGCRIKRWPFRYSCIQKTIKKH